FQAAHDDRPPVYLLPGDRLIEGAAEGVIAQYTDHDRRALAGERPRRPVDELREIEQEHSLHLLRRRGGERTTSGEQASDRERRHGRKRCTASQKPHVSRPKTLRSMALRS